MAPSKFFTAVLAGCLSGLALSAPTSTNEFVKRASVGDVSYSYYPRINGLYPGFFLQGFDRADKKRNI